MIHDSQTAVLERDADNLDITSDELVLRICSPLRHGQIVRLKSTKCSIGSARNCTLRLAARGVHPVHCLIVRGPNATAIRCWAPDTRINGRAFTDTNLDVGDRLTIGPIEFEVLQTAAPNVSPAGPPSYVQPASQRQPSSDSQAQNDLIDGLARLEEQQKVFQEEKRRWEQEHTKRSDELEQQRQSLAQQREEIAQESKSFAQKREELAQEAELLEQQRQEWQDARDKEESQTAAANARNEDLQQEMNRHQAELEQQRDELEKQRQTLAQQRDEIAQEAQSLSQKREELARESELLEQQRQEWQDARDKEESQTAAETVHTEGLEKELEFQRIELEKQRQSLEVQRKTLDEQADVLEKQRQEWQDAHNTEEAQSAAKIEHIDKLQEEMERHQAELEQQRDELEKQHQMLAQQRDELTQQANVLQQQRKEWEEERALHESRSADEIARIEKLHAELQAQRAEHATEDEVAPKPSSGEAPVSLESVLDKLGMDRAAEEEPPSATSTTLGDTQQSTIAQAPVGTQGESGVETTTDSGNQEDEESLDDYMARLMNRVRSMGESTSESSPTNLSKEKGEQTRSNVAVANHVASPRDKKSSDVQSPSSQVAARDELQPPQAEMLHDLAPRGVAPERLENLSAMRELANVSAKTAIERHASRQFRHAARSKLMVASISLLSAGILLGLWWFLGDRGPIFFAGLIAFMIALFWGFQFALMSGKVAIHQKPGELSEANATQKAGLRDDNVSREQSSDSNH